MENVKKSIALFKEAMKGNYKETTFILEKEDIGLEGIEIYISCDLEFYYDELQTYATIVFEDGSTEEVKILFNGSHFDLEDINMKFDDEGMLINDIFEEKIPKEVWETIEEWTRDIYPYAWERIDEFPWTLSENPADLLEFFTRKGLDRFITDELIQEAKEWEESPIGRIRARRG